MYNWGVGHFYLEINIKELFEFQTKYKIKVLLDLVGCGPSKISKTTYRIQSTFNSYENDKRDMGCQYQHNHYQQRFKEKTLFNQCLGKETVLVST